MNNSSKNGANAKHGKRPVINIADLAYGRTPPNARELEGAVLGAILLEPWCFDVVVQVLKAEAFYVEAHQRVFRAMQALALKSQPADLLTVIEQLRSTEELDLVGGPYFVTQLTNSVVSSANIEAHARIIVQKWIGREIIKISLELIHDGFEDGVDAFDLLDAAQARYLALSSSSVKGQAAHLSSLLVERMKRLAEMSVRPDHVTGVPSGYLSLDKITAGWQPTDLIVVAARPSVGKTAFALELARNAAMAIHRPTPVAIFSLEMSAGQLVDRILSAQTGINLDKFVRAKVEESDMKLIYANGVQKLADVPIFIEDTPALNIFELRAKIRRLKAMHGIGLVIIDYLQLMSGLGGESANRGMNREQEISTISRQLKATAKEEQLPIIALSQLSREMEKQGRDPRLSDLRESGAIEQDADMVVFLTRPSYGEDLDSLAPEIRDAADISIAKHRNGPLALGPNKISMYSVLSIQRWMEPEEYRIYSGNLHGPQNPHFHIMNRHPFPPEQDDDDDVTF